MPSTLGACLVVFACGVCALQASAALPPNPVAIIVAAAATAVAVQTMRWPSSRQWVVAAVGIGASFAGGFGYAAWRAEARLTDELPREWEDVDLRVEGVVDDLPARSERGVRFAFAVERVLTKRASVPARLSLAWYAPWPEDGAQVPAPVVRAGERWQLIVRLKRPHGNVNPGGFDLEAWLLQQGLRATGTVRDSAFNQRRDEFAGRWIDHVQRARERVRARIERALPDARYAGVVTALAIGDQRAIPEAQWKVFNRTGITHLVSISGLHVTVFAAFAGGLAYVLARRSVQLTLRLPARKLAAAFGMAAAGTYVMLAGAGIPALRTFAMLAVAAVGIWAGRPGTAGIVWLWALVAVLLWDPFAPLTPGFWLSYGAVALLLYASVGRLRDTLRCDWRGRLAHALGEGAHAQWIVTLGLTPLTLSLFGQVSLIAPVANAVAIPAVTLVVVPLALAGILIPWDALFRLAHAALTPLMRWLEWLSALPDATWQQHAPAGWAVAVACLGALWLLAPRGVPGRWLGALWLVPLFAAHPEPLPDGAFRLTVLDVGQGLAAVVETRRHTLVYDTGPRYNETTDAGGRIVAPFLRASGLRRVDTLVVSHQDLDHSGGALSLLQATPVGELTSSLPADHAIVEAMQRSVVGTAVSCAAGQVWTWDGVRFTMLHPTDAEYEDRYAKTNDRSCVLRIDSGHGSALVTGDIEAKSEALLLRSRRELLRADVLVVPHHGSRTSSTLPFIRAVAPAMAVIGSGYRNRFGHPRADIVARYTMSDVRVLRTDREGAIALTFDTPSIPIPVSARAQRARYWLDAPAADAAPLQ
ncbi:MAG: DNA internalization-related competence protein ComEC/Rec2 [Burkholderiales bacterium]|nr:DNA internalization-related competence protein ComEC/Rec2 [Burkholderiales bacterium]